MTREQTLNEKWKTAKALMEATARVNPLSNTPIENLNRIKAIKDAKTSFDKVDGQVNDYINTHST